MNNKSYQLLTGVHPDLAKIVLEASRTVEFEVVEGVRTIMQEIKYIAQGKSSLKNPYSCRHVPKGKPPYARAIDLVPTVNGVRYPADLSKYGPMVKAMKAAATKFSIPLVWGGDWTTFVDGPHFELDRKVYP